MRLTAAGFTEKDLAFTFGTTPKAIKGFKRRNPAFKEACTRGKEMARSYLVARGLRQAAGYSYEEHNVKTKTVVNKKTGAIEEQTETSVFHKHQKGEPNLLMFMLVNLSRMLKDDDPFTSTHKVEIDEHKQIAITLTGKAAAESIAKLAGAFMVPVIDGEVVKKKRRKKIKSETKDGTEN